MTGDPAELAPVLGGIVRRHGEAVLDNRARLFGLLRDHAAGDLRSARLAMAALDSGAASRLRALGRPAAEPEIAAEADRLVRDFGLAPDLARGAVEAWARFASPSGVPLRAQGAAPATVQPLPLPGAGISVRPLPSAPGAAVQPLPSGLPGAPATGGVGGALRALARRLGR